MDGWQNWKIAAGNSDLQIICFKVKVLMYKSPKLFSEKKQCPVYIQGVSKKGNIAIFA